MRLNLTIEACRSLLDLHKDHDLPDCTDAHATNQFSDSEGWVACTRCWLLAVTGGGKIPKDAAFDMFCTVKLPRREMCDLLETLMDLLEESGPEHPKTKSFLHKNRDNREFVEMAEAAIKIKKAT